MKAFSLMGFVFLSGLTSWAEYRAFKLHILSADGQSEKVVISTLDPDQYRGYHLVREGETVTYSRTWMCRGRTGNMQPICPDPNPPEETAEETPKTGAETLAEPPASAQSPVSTP